MTPHIGDPVMRTDGRTDARTDGRSRDYYVTTKISWLDRLPNLLCNGAPLKRSKQDLVRFPLKKKSPYKDKALFDCPIVLLNTEKHPKSSRNFSGIRSNCAQCACERFAIGECCRFMNLRLFKKFFSLNRSCGTFVDLYFVKLN